MTQFRSGLRPAIAVLLAAAVLPLSPIAAQEAPAAEPPTLDVPPPEAEEPEPEPRAVTIDPPAAPRTRTPTPEAEADQGESPAPPAAQPARTTRRAATRTGPGTAPQAPPVPAASAPAAPAATALPPPPALDALPQAAETSGAAEPTPRTEPEETDAADEGGGSALPWLLAALVAAGAAAFFLLRRRRASGNAYRPVPARPAYREPAPLADPVAEPLAAAPLAAAPAAVPAAVAPLHAARPWIELLMRPGRAGVTEEDARVEFELTVDNRGTAPAEDVRIATWMLAAAPSDAERSLVAPERHAETPPMVIGAGETRTVAATVALPTSEVEGDAVLPVVVADARYTLPDGSEERVTMSYAVGVPNGRELAHFSLDSPSGLHEGVVARPLGEPARA